MSIVSAHRGNRRWGRNVDLPRPRYQTMRRALSGFTGLAFVSALAGLVLPDPLGRAAGVVAVVVVVAAPLIRVAWLAARWYRRGDRRYAAVALSLLLVITAGSAVALLTR